MTDRLQHWDGVYQTRAADEVSWYRADSAVSLRLLRRWASRAHRIVDVGAGASTLVDDLLEDAWTDVTVLDVSEEALGKVRSRLGARAEDVRFVVDDVCLWQPQMTFGAWHDRAVFHFLIEPADRRRYLALAESSIAPGGVVVLATFAADGPTSCSGLPTARYGPDELVALFRPGFELVESEREEHRTPAGVIQAFTWVVLRRA